MSSVPRREIQTHVDLVVEVVTDQESLFFNGPCSEAEGFVKVDRRSVVGLDTNAQRPQIGHPSLRVYLPCVRDHGLEQTSCNAQATPGWTDVETPDEADMSGLFGPGACQTNYAGNRIIRDSGHDVSVLQSVCDAIERLGLFLCEGCAECIGMKTETFGPDFSEGRGI